MSTILTILSKLKLSLSEFAAIALAAIISITVAAFKLQGSRLHKAQVDLLASKLQVSHEQASSLVSAAEAKYDQALKTYHDAGGTL